MLFSACWDLSLMNQNKFSFKLGSIICSDCKNTVFFMLRLPLINQNEFSFEVTNPVIARVLLSACCRGCFCSLIL